MAYPDRDPIELATDIGYPDPRMGVQRMVDADNRKGEGKKLSKLSDRDRAIHKLRNIVSGGNDSSAVAAARALLEASPSPTNGDGSSVLVVYYGRENPPTGPGTVTLQADVTPEEIAEALDYVRAKRAASTETQLEAYAIEQGINTEDLGLAWELFQHPEAKASALRVYYMSQASEPEVEEIAS